MDINLCLDALVPAVPLFPWTGDISVAVDGSVGFGNKPFLVGEAFESNAGLTFVSSFANAFVDVEMLPLVGSLSVGVSFAICFSANVFTEIGFERDNVVPARNWSELLPWSDFTTVGNQIVVFSTHPFAMSRLQDDAFTSFSEAPSLAFSSWDGVHGPILFMEPGSAKNFITILSAEELFKHLVIQLEHISSLIVFLNHKI